MNTRIRALVRLGALLGVTTLGIAYGVTAADAASDEDVWVVSDGPCPEGTSATVPVGSSYEAGIWEDADGNLIGAAAVEDNCVVLITDDLAPPRPQPTGGLPMTR